MKRYIYILAAMAWAITATSCAKMMSDADDAKVIAPVNVAYKVDIKSFTNDAGATVNAPADWFNSIKVIFINFAELTQTEASVDANGIAHVKLTPGIYNIAVRKTEKYNGKSYILNGLNQNIPLVKNMTDADITEKTTVAVQPILGSALCFREIYYCGAPGYYFRDQFYEIYNNGDEVVYLDHLCFAQLYPTNATANLPQWPAEDGSNKYAYGVTLWQIQGKGTDYPLKPGESFVIAQEAADHTKMLSYSGGHGGLDNSHSEWECWSGNARSVSMPKSLI